MEEKYTLAKKVDDKLDDSPEVDEPMTRTVRHLGGNTLVDVSESNISEENVYDESYAGDSYDYGSQNSYG
jgi:hypothetical protein